MTVKEHSFKVPRPQSNSSSNNKAVVRNNIINKSVNHRGASNFIKGPSSNRLDASNKTGPVNNKNMPSKAAISSNNNNFKSQPKRVPNIINNVNPQIDSSAANPTPVAMLSRAINGRFTPKCAEGKNDVESFSENTKQSSTPQAPCSSVNFYPSGCPGGRMF